MDQALSTGLDDARADVAKELRRRSQAGDSVSPVEREAEWFAYLTDLYQLQHASWLAVSSTHRALEAERARAAAWQLGKHALVVISASLVLTMLFVRSTDETGGMTRLNVFAVSLLLVSMAAYPFLQESRREERLRRQIQDLAVTLDEESPEWIRAFLEDPTARAMFRAWPAPGEVTEADVRRWPVLGSLVTPRNPEVDFQTAYRRYRESPSWAAKAEAALAHARQRCQACASADTPLDVYHRTFERILDERPDDLIVLCPACHQALRQGGRLAA